MGSSDLDDIDRVILHALQEDARHNTNAAISERAGVSASTVGKRVARLEECGIISGYRAEIDYEKAGFPLDVLFICTASITDRDSFTEQAIRLDGVVNVWELMTGERNVYIRAIGASKDDITRIANELDSIGYAVADEILLRGEYNRPSNRFDATDSNG